MQGATQVITCMETPTQDAKLRVAHSMSAHLGTQTVCACSREEVLWRKYPAFQTEARMGWGIAVEGLVGSQAVKLY